MRFKTIGTNEPHTAHVSELKSYYSNNSSLSIIFTRSFKSISVRSGQVTESNQQKFERKRDKFRRNIQRENDNKRRTIILDECEMPSSSKKCSSKRQRVPRQTSPASSKFSPKPRKARKYRVKPGEICDLIVSTQTSPSTYDTIHISEGETSLWED